MNKLLLAIFLLILIPVFGFLFYQSQFVVTPINNPDLNDQDVIPEPDMVACTSEAKLCFDGSGVGRVGPKCEFEKCPLEDQIFVTEPYAYSLVTKEVRLKGKAVGSWFFEGSLPISLESEDGMVLATGTASAQGEWMTPNFVPFTAVLVFDEPKEALGYLVIKKSNPSGLSENDEEIRMPLMLKEEITLE